MWVGSGWRNKITAHVDDGIGRERSVVLDRRLDLVRLGVRVERIERKLLEVKRNHSSHHRRRNGGSVVPVKTVSSIVPRVAREPAAIAARCIDINCAAET